MQLTVSFSSPPSSSPCWLLQFYKNKINCLRRKMIGLRRENEKFRELRFNKIPVNKIPVARKMKHDYLTIHVCKLKTCPNCTKIRLSSCDSGGKWLDGKEKWEIWKIIISQNVNVQHFVVIWIHKDALLPVLWRNSCWKYVLFIADENKKEEWNKETD